MQQLIGLVWVLFCCRIETRILDKVDSAWKKAYSAVAISPIFQIQMLPKQAQENFAFFEIG